MHLNVITIALVGLLSSCHALDAAAQAAATSPTWTGTNWRVNGKKYNLTITGQQNDPISPFTATCSGTVGKADQPCGATSSVSSGTVLNMNTTMTMKAKKPPVIRAYLLYNDTVHCEYVAGAHTAPKVLGSRNAIIESSFTIDNLLVAECCQGCGTEGPWTGGSSE